jgi:hypothetical protein
VSRNLIPENEVSCRIVPVFAPWKCSTCFLLIISGETTDDSTTMIHGKHGVQTTAFKSLTNGEFSSSKNHSLTYLEGGGQFKHPYFGTSITQDLWFGNGACLTYENDVKMNLWGRSARSPRRLHFIR